MYRFTISLLALALLISCKEKQPEAIDRHALVSRHNVEIASIDSLNSLTVGNGDFAFTVDITGLQTFPLYHETGIPLGTMSNWCWHSYPNVHNYNHNQVLKYFTVNGREVPYYHDFGREKTTERALASSYLRANPHRMNMALVGLKMLDKEGNRVDLEDILNPHQVLDLWKGEINSSFEIDGVPVTVNTVCHPEDDIIAFRVHSELIASGRLNAELRFPEADPGWKNISLWGEDKNHQSSIVQSADGITVLEHQQDTMDYVVRISQQSGSVVQSAAHSYEILPGENENELVVSISFAPSPEKLPENVENTEVEKASEESWLGFWNEGGAVDFSACTDPRANELERRVVLSQYLTKVNCSGILPPQETGLTYNSWFGKFHLEMHWWHGVHFPLWQRGDVLEKQMGYYKTILKEAKELAAFQGYEGARWPKMLGPERITSPSSVGNYLIWQEPHYIYFAELLYKTSSNPDSLLKEYSDLVFETADFMASYAYYDAERDRYVLGPALIPAQETFSAQTTINPAFEVTYWYWALNTAIEWKKRTNQEVPENWLAVASKMSDLTVQDSLYLFTENGTDSYTNERYISDHPVVLGSLGVLPPTDKIDREIMLNTFNKVVSLWNWPHTWGWDYPMVAMTAAELGIPDKAMDFLMLDVQKNTYLPNGHNYQDGRLTLYLPGNGGLLTAVARMCTKDQFPKDGTWEVKWENLNDF